MRTIHFPLLLLCVLALGAGTVFMAGCGDQATKSAEAACSCDQDKAADAGWCEKCNVGYVKGTKTECKDCVGAAKGGAPCAACANKAGEGKGGSLLADTTGGAGTDGAPCKAEGAQCKGDCANCKNKDCPCKAKADGESAKVACVCAQGKAGEPVWCKACDVGYVDGKKAGCPGCVKNALKKLEAAKSPD